MGTRAIMNTLFCLDTALVFDKGIHLAGTNLVIDEGIHFFETDTVKLNPDFPDLFEDPIVKDNYYPIHGFH